MNTVLMAVAAFVVAVGVLVTIHEYGHFWVARRLGVKVLRFSVGFGAPLWQRVAADGTEYRIAAIPLGGYVQMLDEREATVAPHEVHRAFNRQSLWRRSAIVLAGPAANFLFAVLAYWLILVIGVTGVRPLIGEVSVDSAADRAELRRGDLIQRIDGREVNTWQDAGMALVDGAVDGRSAQIQVRGADGERRSLVMDLSAAGRLEEPGRLLPDLGIEPYRPQIDAVLGEPMPEGPAREAGLVPGDRITALDGEAIAGWEELVAGVRQRPGATVRLQVERAYGRETVAVTLDRQERNGEEIGFLGATPEVPEGLWDRLYTVERKGLLAATPAAFVRTAEYTGLTLRLLGRMVTGDVSLKNISGPINIASYAGQSASIGLVSFLGFLAIVSISLGIINLLPIPMLDGGHLMYFLVEAIKGSPVSERTQIAGQQFGILALIGLMSLALYNDIVRLVG